MRIGVFLVGLAFLTASARPVDAAPESPIVKSHGAGRIVPQNAPPSGLRGAVGAAKTPAIAGLGPLGASRGPALATSPTSASIGAGQCRPACAHAYYFCLSGPNTTDCASSWSQCLTDCSFPPLTIAH